MAFAQRRDNEEEFVQRGDAIYETDVGPHLKPEDIGKFVAIDIETSEYEIDGDKLISCDRLRGRCPEARIWLVQIGSPYGHHVNGRPLFR